MQKFTIRLAVHDSQSVTMHNTNNDKKIDNPDTVVVKIHNTHQLRHINSQSGKGFKIFAIRMAAQIFAYRMEGQMIRTSKKRQ